MRTHLVLLARPWWGTADICVRAFQALWHRRSGAGTGRGPRPCGPAAGALDRNVQLFALVMQPLQCVGEVFRGPSMLLGNAAARVGGLAQLTACLVDLFEKLFQRKFALVSPGNELAHKGTAGGSLLGESLFELSSGKLPRGFFKTPEQACVHGLF